MPPAPESVTGGRQAGTGICGYLLRAGLRAKWVLGTRKQTAWKSLQSSGRQTKLPNDSMAFCVPGSGALPGVVVRQSEEGFTGEAAEELSFSEIPRRKGRVP